MFDPRLFQLPLTPHVAEAPLAHAPAARTPDAGLLTLRAFATEAYPLRISGLTMLKACDGAGYLSWRENLLTLPEDRMSSEAADTGTAVGMAVELWHRDRHARTDDIMARVARASAEGEGAARPPFAAARLGDAERVLALYRVDPRNVAAEVPEWSLEAEVRLTLPPHELDPTGAPIVFVGHLDQIRVERATLWHWDLKHSSYGGRDLVAQYSWQQIGYAYAIEQTFGRRAGWGGIIRTTGYLVKGAGKTKSAAECDVFFPASLRRQETDAVLNGVRLTVAMIRAGALVLRPGSHCGWCSASPAGLDYCVEELARLGAIPV